jgi:hypothetical protein
VQAPKRGTSQAAGGSTVAKSVSKASRDDDTLPIPLVDELVDERPDVRVDSADDEGIPGTNGTAHSASVRADSHRNTRWLALPRTQ